MESSSCKASRRAYICDVRQEPRNDLQQRWGLLLGARLKIRVHSVLMPLVRLLVRLHFKPDWFTVLGLLIGLLATGAFATGQLRWGAAMILTGGFCDILDGELARQGRAETKFGALLDSTFDRYFEIFLYFGIGAYLIRQSEWAASGILFFAMSGSLMVSYVRARAEGLGEDCKVGFMQRPERLVALALGAAYGHEGLVFILVVLAVTTNYTVIERLAHIRNKMRSSSPATARGS